MVVRCHVADDREAEAGASGLAAPTAVDAVEALEDALEVVGGDAHAPVGHRQPHDRAAEHERGVSRRGWPTLVVGLGPGLDDLAGDRHDGALGGVGDGVLEQGVEGADELAAIADDGHRRVELLDVEADGAVLGARLDPVDGLDDGEVDRHRVAGLAELGLETGEVEQVVDDPADPERLVVDAPGEAGGHVAVPLVHQRLGQEAEGAHGGLELVADVGDEVSAHVVEATPLGDVLDHGDHAEGAAAVVDQRGVDAQGAPGRSVELEGLLGLALVPGLGEEVGDRLGGEGVAATALHHRGGHRVAVDHRARLVAEHEAEGQDVERAAEPDGVGARVGDRLCGRTGDRLEVGQGALDRVVLLLGSDTEAAAEGHESLGEALVP